MENENNGGQPTGGLDELDVLAHQASGLDAEAQAEYEAAAGVEKPQPVDTAAEMVGLFDGVGMMLEPMLPATGRMMQKQAPHLGAAFDRVALKHGWNVPGVLEKYAPEIALLVAALPVAGAVKMDIANIKAEKLAAQRQQGGEHVEAGQAA